MSERKVLNKYYPPDFDASKLPRVKREKNRQFTIRLMAPFNMRCKTCGEYIYRGKKFNARKEDVIGKTYLGIQIYRFYIKCTKCLAEITFLTDPESQDYEMENGAIRNFESIRLAEKQAEIEAKQQKEEEANNPMKILENRTRDSRREMAVLETLEDLRELNAANASVDPKILLNAEEEYKKQLEKLQQEEDEEEIKRILAKRNNYNIILDEDVESSEEEEEIETKQSTSKIKQEFTESNASKKVKIEPEEFKETKQSTVKLFFPKPSIDTQSQLSSVGKLKKENVASFIKKKPETNDLNNLANSDSNATSSVSNDKPKETASLNNLLSCYGSDSDSQD